jgi:RNA polymerase sigma-70 factor (ECF subfamily)
VIPAELLDGCRRAWPGIELADADFTAYAAQRIAGTAIADTQLRDLWLACAVGRGDRVALRVFEDQWLSRIPEAVSHLGGSALADDVIARVRERVLAPGGSGKLTEYRGRGDLHGWLRVVAVREALQLLRQRKRETPLSSSEELARELDSIGPISEQERGVYRDAFSRSLAALTARERNLMRQHYLYGTSIDELGTLYGVHRATIARWIAQVREALLERTRDHVARALRMTGTELDSVMDRIAHHIDISLRHTLSNE